MGFYILCRTLCACAVCRSMNNIYIMFDVEALAKKKKKFRAYEKSSKAVSNSMLGLCIPSNEDILIIVRAHATPVHSLPRPHKHTRNPLHFMAFSPLRYG